MHIRDSNNQRFISEEEYNIIKAELEHGLSAEELKRNEEEDNIYHEYVMNHKTPEQIIRDKINSHSENLKVLFDGIALRALEPENETDEAKIFEQANNLTNIDFKHSYSVLDSNDNKFYIIEKLRAQPANIEAIALFIYNSIYKGQVKVT